MQNRLSEFKTSVQAEGKTKAQVAVDMMSDDLNEEERAFMPEFFAEVGQVKTAMSLIRRNIKAIQDAYDKQPWSSIDSNQSQGISEFEELLDSTNAAASNVRNRLKAMKAENDKIPAENAQKRIRANMHSVLSKKFLLLLQEYSALQNSFREKTRERFQRQAEIVQPGVTNEEIDHMIASGGDYFSDKFMSETKHVEAKNALMRIQEQGRDLRHLERNIQELHQMFLDMSALVESSTETMEKVELDFNTTVAESGAAVTHVTRAEEYVMQKRRKLAIVGVGIVAIILVVVVVIVAILAAKGAIFS